MQERQRLHQCLRHSLNNMFQSSQFSSGELDAIADTLAPGRPPLPFLHPHRTLLWGNYDVNVLEVALRRHGKARRQHCGTLCRLLVDAGSSFLPGARCALKLRPLCKCAGKYTHPTHTHLHCLASGAAVARPERCSF